MTPELWQRAEAVYRAALTREGEARAAFVREECSGNAALRREVELLLAQAASAEGLAESPAADVANEPGESRRLASASLSDPGPSRGALQLTPGWLARAAQTVSGVDSSALSGRRLGGYLVQARLGAGGMGEVYRARDTRLGRDVAIKILPHLFTSDPGRLARFEREARILATLNHPNIGAIYGLEDADGIRALVLELVDGETLADRIARGPLPLKDALPMARQIADALEAAHDKGIVHRDLKPRNVALTRDGTVKVLDFGLAKATVRDGTPGDGSHVPTMTIGGTREGLVIGTAAYMSPEQARGQAVDKRSDIWAFGCVLYEMLTTMVAFSGETISDTIAAVLEREPSWTALPAATPPNIRRLLQRCLEKNPKRRLRDIGDARIEIDDSIAVTGEPSDAPKTAAARLGAMPTLTAEKDLRRRQHDIADAGNELDDVSREPAATVPQTPPFESRRLVKLRPIWVLAAAAVVIVMLGTAQREHLWPAQSATYRSSLARLMTALPAAQVLEKGRFPPVALSPDGRLMVYAAAVNGGRTRLYLRPLDELAARPIPATDGAMTPFFSPDSRWLAFYANGFLKKVSVNGGVPLLLAEAPPVWSATWGENNNIVFATTQAHSGLWLVSADGGEPVQLTTLRPDEAQHGYPQLLPGGTQVLFSVLRKNGWHLALLLLKNRSWRFVGNGRVIGEGAQYLPTGHLVYVQSGGLVATPFDPSSGNLDQPPVPLLERIETSRFGGAYFAFAAVAGTLVYVPAGTTVADRTLIRVDRDGRAAPLIDAHAGYQYPAFSPDGRQVAVMIASEMGGDIWTIDLERATRIRFTAGGTTAFPVWAPDGSQLAFQSTAPGPWNLFVKPFDGTTEARSILGVVESSPGVSSLNPGENLLPGTLPTLSGAGPQFPTSWSPDGSTIAFHERKPNGERDIWVVGPGKNPVPFLITPFDERSAQFSPNGKWLAYVSDESGRNDVFVQPFPGPGPKWLVSTDGGTDPVWSRDGRELFYRRNDEMMVVSVAPQNEFSVSRPQRLFELRFDAGDNGPNYDVSPDGKWFVMARDAQGPIPAELHLVLNWFSEVRARTQAATAYQERGALQQWAALPKVSP